jgi:hypothetical protein
VVVAAAAVVVGHLASGGQEGGGFGDSDFRGSGWVFWYLAWSPILKQAQPSTLSSSGLILHTSLPYFQRALGPFFFFFFEQREAPEVPIFIHLIGNVQRVLHIPEIVKIGR